MFDHELAINALNQVSRLVNTIIERTEGVMRMRDKIAHHYFEVDAEVVLLTVKEDIPQVKDVVEKMIVEMNKK